MASRVSALAVLLCSLAACGDDGGAPMSNDSDPDGGAGMDAGPRRPPGTGEPGPDARPLPDVPPFEGMFAEPAEGRACNLVLGLECDGHEDCPGSQRCCGTFDMSTFSYTRMACSDACTGTGQREVCHPGDTCPAGQICRNSQILPFGFVSVCAMPGAALTEPTGREIEGEIVCGEGPTCVAGSEKCCLRATVSVGSGAGQAYEPYCASREEACDCDFDPDPVGGDGDGDGDGAGDGDGGPVDEDAGSAADDGGV